MGADSEILLSLYRSARELPTPEFQRVAISLIRPVLRFESAIWGAGYFSGPQGDQSLVPISSATLEIDPAGFAFWKSINRADKIIPVVRRQPWRTVAFHAPTVFSAKEDAVMRDYAGRFGRQSYMVTALSDIDTALFEWCSLYRHDPADQFDATERERCQMLVKHLAEALKVNRLAQESGVQPSGAGGELEWAALVTTKGDVVSAQAEFLTACRRQWTDFDGKRIPATVWRQLMGAGLGQYRGNRVTIRARKVADFLWLTAIPTPSKAELPPRRMDVATLFARGFSNKDVARLLNVSPSTVRNQVAAAYKDLGISNRHELQVALQQSESRSER